MFSLCCFQLSNYKYILTTVYFATIYIYVHIHKWRKLEKLMLCFAVKRFSLWHFEFTTSKTVIASCYLVLYIFKESIFITNFIKNQQTRKHSWAPITCQKYTRHWTELNPTDITHLSQVSYHIYKRKTLSK